MPELSRSLQPRHITMISIGGLFGAGLFASSRPALAPTGPSIVLSYLITGTLVLLVMRMLGEMAVALPAVRSFTEFARAGLGPWAGFIAGWLYWYFWMIVVPVEAIAGANILHAWLGLPPWLLGLALMGIMTAVNLMSARSYGEFEFWFPSLKVAAILVFIALAAAYACGFTSPTGPTLRNLSAYDGFMPKGWVAVLAGGGGRRGEDEQLGDRAHPDFLRGLGAADRHGGAVDTDPPGGIAVHAGAHHHGLRVGAGGDERHHPYA